MSQSILLVDDRKENLLALEALLEEDGRQLLKANNGNEALQMALKNDVALILLDVQMPDMDGFEVAQLLRGNPKTRQIPVIFCTAISKEKKYITRGYDVGAVDYLFKPIDPDLLTAKVRVFLELDAQKRKLQQTLLTLHKVQQENERLLRAMGEGVVGLDKAGRITFANPAACNLLGRDVSSLIGMGIDALVFFDGHGRCLWPWEDSPARRAVSQGEAWQSTELHALRNARPVPVEATMTPINDRGNTFAGAVVVLRDAKARERALETFKERRKTVRKRLSAELTLFDRASGANIGRLVNLSEGGFRIATKREVTDGQRLSLSMILPEMVRGNTTVSFDGVAVWSAPASYGGDRNSGFRFVDMKAESLEVIRFLLDKY
jgi:PAS domain S-box-containing protein